MTAKRLLGGCCTVGGRVGDDRHYPATQQADTSLTNVHIGGKHGAAPETYKQMVMVMVMLKKKKPPLVIK